MNSDLDALARRLHLTIDDLLIEHAHMALETTQGRDRTQLTEAEPLTLAVIQASVAPGG